MEITYFAYGSNMSRAQMSERCPNAEFLSIGVLSNFRFIINSRGVATLLREEGTSAIGLVWKLTEECEYSLDIFEGVGKGLYKKETHLVTLQGSSKSQECMVYLASDQTNGSPRPNYLEGIIKAAELEHLDRGYVAYLRGWLNK